ncbi:MAG TPA: hypothetical protein VNG70_12605 [Candidatus Limnocylindria bacterium]|jgi:hypothetical protein|nr:hypothetical protein [Candidatus Limnocylindria bacterium]
MDEMRRNVNEEFDKRQAELGDLSGASERILKGAFAARDTRGGNRMQFAAGIAAVLIGAVVIATFVYIRAGTHSIPAGPPRSTSPTHLTQPLDVPDSTPVILYHDPANSDQIDGITWDGRNSGRVGQGGAPGGTSNPAGSLYSTAADIRDRTGTVVGPLADKSPNALHVFWADDEFHYCQVVRSGEDGITSPGLLQLVLPGRPPSNIARIGIFAPASQNRPPPIVVACSVENDRAVVYAGSKGGLTVQDWVVQLSTGRILWTHSIDLPTPPSGVGIAATRDGRFVAESILSATQSAATIYGPDGSAVTDLASSSVAAFSWDGSLAVTLPNSGAPVRLIRWRDGSIVWTGPANANFRTARAEPGGGRIAVGLTVNNPADDIEERLVNLYVVSTDGKLSWELSNLNLN